MKKIAFVFMKIPHGTSSSQEGLEALLASFALTKDIGVFFISDGVCQLLTKQNPNKILTRDYIVTYKLLELYDINTCYICQEDLEIRGFSIDSCFILPVTVISANVLRRSLAEYDVILTF
ncbi:Intracellular sulfur oxidation protein DsrF [Candidatus Arsenophonus lipoptenae]|uniref:Intracellular sulfur oxidation protein DsrF n=1 Tax=Candidatus Arsenophonus lipoptenae TaxID=634113 RepID=A0A120HPV2_9GAMM|nr:sulfurtransferase complex subunit TusC [Candidatus Arsenophonus lipoptenae]AMA64875.1 Intracellular sulfur oxidation protein DsrF [Candidatus Arsenophonus lipoptenae]